MRNPTYNTRSNCGAIYRKMPPAAHECHHPTYDIMLITKERRGLITAPAGNDRKHTADIAQISTAYCRVLGTRYIIGPTKHYALQSLGQSVTSTGNNRIIPHRHIIDSARYN